MIRIVGFGGCMLGGYPHGRENSFFTLLVEGIRQARPDLAVESTCVSLGAFPVARASGFLASRVLERKPDVVVIQFGAVDTGISLRRLLRLRPGRDRGRAGKHPDDVSSSVGRSKGRLFLLLKSLVCRSLGLKPAGHSSFLPTMERMIRELTGRGISVVVVSPFPKADPAENRWAQRYGLELEKLSRELGFTYVDCHGALGSLPLRRFLMEDGVHLNRFGHQTAAASILSAATGTITRLERKIVQ